MTEYLKQIAPRLCNYGEMLNKKTQLADKSWRLIRHDGQLEEYTFTWDDEVFQTGSGGVTRKGKWRLLISTNQLYMDFGAGDELLLKQTYLDKDIILLTDGAQSIFYPFVNSNSGINTSEKLLQHFNNILAPSIELVPSKGNADDSDNSLSVIFIVIGLVVAFFVVVVLLKS